LDTHQILDSFNDAHKAALLAQGLYLQHLAVVQIGQAKQGGKLSLENYQ
jgi:hypothetical protein